MMRFLPLVGSLGSFRPRSLLRPYSLPLCRIRGTRYLARGPGLKKNWMKLRWETGFSIRGDSGNWRMEPVVSDGQKLEVGGSPRKSEKGPSPTFSIHWAASSSGFPLTRSAGTATIRSPLSSVEVQATAG